MTSIAVEGTGAAIHNMTESEEEGITRKDSQMKDKLSTNGYMPATGGCKGTIIEHGIGGLPEATITTFEAAATRLLDLKKKLNELQTKREELWQKQKRSVRWLTKGCFGAFVFTCLVSRRRKKTNQIKASMREVIDQINQLRERFGNDPGWNTVESLVVINKGVFARSMDRDQLEGGM